jgi:hypothetical protein
MEEEVRLLWRAGLLKDILSDQSQECQIKMARCPTMDKMSDGVNQMVE